MLKIGSVIVICLATAVAAPCAFAELELPPALAALPQAAPASPPPPVSSPSPQVSSGAAPSAVPQTPPPTVSGGSSAEFQQWLQSNGSQSPPSKPPFMQSEGPGVPPFMQSTGRPSAPPEPIKRAPLTYEESKQVMLETAPEPPQPPLPESEAAFDTMMQQNMPLSPQQVVKLRQQIDTAQRAAAIPPVIPPKPVSTTIMVNLAPGTTPPAIRLAQGYVSALVFVDSTGAPWPIAQFDIGNPKTVNLQWDGKTNIILIQAIAPYANGDIVVRLVGLPTPITLEIVSGQRVVDYRVDIHVSGIGPNTKELPMGASFQIVQINCYWAS